MPTTDQAVEALEELGLTEYEARCFAALTRVSHATAKEISQLSDVPRSRVYDTVTRLHNRGLVDVQQSDPRRYKATSKDAAFEKLRHDYETSIESAASALDELESAETLEERGAWAIEDHEHVESRLHELIDEAESEIVLLVAADEMLEDDDLERIAAAAERGCAVFVDVPSSAVRSRVQEAIPEATVVVSPDLAESAAIEGNEPGKMLLVDRHSVLASAVSDGRLPDVREETAIWSYGDDHGLAVWFRKLVEGRVAGAAECAEGTEDAAETEGDEGT